MPRSAEFERDFLKHACHGAGLGMIGLVEMAQARLEQGAVDYGDKSYSLSIEELLGEIEEEATDVAAWSSIACQCDEFNELDPEKRMLVEAFLESSVGLAAQQILIVREVRKTLKR